MKTLSAVLCCLIIATQLSACHQQPTQKTTSSFLQILEDDPEAFGKQILTLEQNIAALKQSAEHGDQTAANTVMEKQTELQARLNAVAELDGIAG